jgi:LysM repeat protein
LKLPASLDDPEAQEDQPGGDEQASTGESAATTGSGAADEGVRFVQQSASTAAYTVKSGDTLLAIAINLDVDWEELAAANDLNEETFLQIGQQLKVPAAPTLMSARSAGAASDETSSSKTAGFTSSSATAPDSSRTHRVKSGDTVYGIALQYGIDWQELLRVNDLDEDSLLQLDQQLTLP